MYELCANFSKQNIPGNVHLGAFERRVKTRPGENSGDQRSYVGERGEYSLDDLQRERFEGVLGLELVHLSDFEDRKHGRDLEVVERQEGGGEREAWEERTRVDRDQTS